MSDWYYAERPRPPARSPVLWALAISLAFHGLVLWQWVEQTRTPAADPNTSRAPDAPLAVQLAPSSRTPPVQQPAEPAPAPPPPARRAATPRPPVIARLPPPAAPVLTQPVPAPVVVPPPAPDPPEAVAAVPPPVPPPAPTPIEGDLSAYIAARRRARGEAPAAPSAAEAEKARRDAIVASNLASLNVTASGQLRNAGGLFSIRRMTEDEAEFLFFGWSGEAQRRQAQTIEVKRGTQPDIRYAVVRKMIAMIREEVDGDFTFRSARSGRDVRLSARPADNEELEQFMLREFFDVMARGR